MKADFILIRTCEPSPSAINIRKNSAEKNELAGICDIASGYVINVRPGPDDSAYLSTGSFSSLDKNPIVANTAKPANTPVKQSHDTTMHICLNNHIVNLHRFLN